MVDGSPRQINQASSDREGHQKRMRCALGGLGRPRPLERSERGRCPVNRAGGLDLGRALCERPERGKERTTAAVMRRLRVPGAGPRCARRGRRSGDGPAFYRSRERRGVFRRSGNGSGDDKGEFERRKNPHPFRSTARLPPLAAPRLTTPFPLSSPADALSQRPLPRRRPRVPGRLPERAPREKGTRSRPCRRRPS